MGGGNEAERQHGEQSADEDAGIREMVKSQPKKFRCREGGEAEKVAAIAQAEGTPPIADQAEEERDVYRDSSQQRNMETWLAVACSLA